MATANASRLLTRLAALRKTAESSPAVLPDIAFDTIRDVQDNAASRLSSDDTQVGFDLAQFQANIAAPGPLRTTGPGVGSIGILDPEKMGTLSDFEAIANVPGLYHQGTGDRAGTWEHLVYPNPSLREEVARERRAVWGDRTPQWLLLEDGFAGNGAFPPTPPHHFIADGTRPATIIGRMTQAFTRLFRGL